MPNRQPGTFQLLPVVLDTDRKEHLHNLFTTALEGGIGYWSDTEAYRWSKKGTDDNDLDGFRAVITEYEADNAPHHIIDRVVIERGLYRLAMAALDPSHRDACTNGGEPFEWKRTERRTFWLGLFFGMDVDYDSGDADNVVQAGIFGDLKYG